MSNTKTQATKPRANLLVVPQATKRYQVTRSLTGFTLSDVEAGASAFLPKAEGWDREKSQNVADLLNRDLANRAS